MRILVADDDDLTRLNLEYTLKQWNYDVVFARDGLEAWDILDHADPPRIAILDWLMPGLDGTEICQRLRMEKNEIYTYVILLTGKDTTDSKIEGLQAGADDYLTKPLVHEELKAQLSVAERILALQDSLRYARDEADTANIKYQSLFDSALSVAIISTDQHGIIDFFNKGAEHIFGYTQGEVIGAENPLFLFGATQFTPGQCTTCEISPRMDFQRFVERCIGCHNDNPAYLKNEWTCMRKDGQAVIIDLAVSAMRDTHDRPIGFLFTATDITSRKLAEQALADSENQLQSIFNTVQDAIITINSDGMIQTVNKAAETIFGYTQTEVLGKNVTMVVPESDRELPMLSSKKSIDAKMLPVIGQRREVQGMRKNGDVFDADFSLNPMYIGSDVFYVGVVRDISEKKKAEWINRRQSQLLQALHEATSNFVVAKNPLEIFKHMLDALLETTESECGFIAKIQFRDEGAPFLIMQAMHDGKWRDAEKKEIAQQIGKGMEFTHLELLLTRILQTEDYVIENDISAEVCQRGLSDGKTALRSFCGVPIRIHDQIVAMYAMGNRRGGYDEELIRFLVPFTSTCGILFEGLKTNQDLKYFYEESMESQARLYDFLENANDLIQSVDSQGNFVYVNRAWKETLGYTQDDIKGMTLFDIISKESMEHCVSVFQEVMQGTRFNNMEVTFIRKDGEKIILSGSVNCRIVDGQPIFTRSILHNITDEKRAQQELREAKDEAEQANKSKSLFLANMSHEIRTPMNAIIGLTELLQKTSLNALQQDYLKKVHDSSKALLGIINDILDFSKIEAGKLVIERIDFYLHDIVDLVAEMLSFRATEKGVEFIIAIDADVPYALIGDPLRLQQILINLVTNAIKFTEQGEIILKASLQETKGSSVRLRFDVKDTGIGIDPDVLPHLFHSFQQADGSTTRKFGGTGLGLSICKRLVEMMGGDIFVESQVGWGSTFSFQIEFTQQEEPVGIQLRTPEGLRHKRILLVDDNATLRSVLSGMLESMSFRVVSHSSLDSVFTTLQTVDANGDSFDLVLLDWMLEDREREEAIEVIRHIHDVSHCPVLLMVPAFGRGEIVEIAKKAQIPNFLTKPITKTVLLNTIAHVLGVGLDISEHAVSQHEGAAASVLQGARILLVEDNHINQLIAKEILADVGIQVDIAENGKEAIAAVQKKEYDGILMDLQMPEMDGYTATSLIRADKRFKQLPIIAMTAHAMQEEREKCLHVGMNDHITKPIQVSLLYQTLEKWIKPSCAGLEIAPDRPPDTSREGTANLPEMTGLDVQSGVERVLGNETLYRQLLLEFGLRFSNAAQQLQDFLSAQDRVAAQQLAHTLKGTAANISADWLAKMAQELEAALKEGNTDALPALVEQVKAALDEVQTSISKLQVADDGLSRSSTPVFSNREEMKASLRRIAFLLQQSNMEAEDAMQAFLASLGDDSMGSVYKPVLDAIEQLDYEGAYHDLIQIAARQKLSLS
jgi:PAS domain S-box-containing protein